MKRREIFAGNWKMYKDYNGAVALVNGLKGGLGDIGAREVAIFPPALYVREMVSLCTGTRIDVGVQNMYFEKEGAFTGELAPAMVKDCGARYILIGHSERRHVFRETDVEVNKKVAAALAVGLDPMVCVGELLAEREAGTSEAVVKTQLVEALKGVTKERMAKVVVAYEPVWAIGTGKVATPEIAETMHRFIRETLGALYDGATAAMVPVLYGGSVKPDNIAGLYAMENIDGCLVGGASLASDSFLDIIKVK
ncbi:MAG TPA: triose-phosphate isomerase [Spirochaetota bacterium]|nr:triose-phosphate isomerase [Spirochaetota bacterium]HNT11772.1 triose-phosphate isomerase [Spirochaetota bacterium]HNV47110.1 triose-phosphate isomerase [Spirochaetota bacterium]HOS40523.1 triose-phosphate isomerase [Spirochaetota bacterium]HPI24321.1 triose-phosphate isomerase [Spirochaetota bacterium]